MKAGIGGSDAAHRASHRALLTAARSDLPADRHRSPDAIVVSAARPPEFLLPAMELAVELDALFVALCSGAARRRAVGGIASEVPGLRYAVVPVPADYDNRLVMFRTSTVLRARVRRLGDLSLKRNLGLLLGHLAGWRSLLFLDDDIRQVDPAAVRLAATVVVSGGAGGMPAQDYPDNSVVCHARRAVGEPQDVFVSGSALLVDCQHIDSFFPRVYNEDWLFLADALRRGGVSVVGASTQLGYDPFASPHRAEAEEFGDVLAEGLVGLLHAGESFVAASAGQWSDVLVQRKQLIMDIAARTDRLDAELARKVLASLKAAEHRRSAIEGYDLASYVRLWRDDLETWRRRLRRIPQGQPPAAALAWLGLRQHAILSGDLAPDAPAPAGPVRPVAAASSG